MRTFKEGAVIKCTRRNSAYSAVEEGDYYEVEYFSPTGIIMRLVDLRTGYCIFASTDNDFDVVEVSEFLVSQITEEVHLN